MRKKPPAKKTVKCDEVSHYQFNVDNARAFIVAQKRTLDALSRYLDPQYLERMIAHREEDLKESQRQLRRIQAKLRSAKKAEEAALHQFNVDGTRKLIRVHKRILGDLRRYREPAFLEKVIARDEEALKNFQSTLRDAQTKLRNAKKEREVKRGKRQR